MAWRIHQWRRWRIYNRAGHRTFHAFHQAHVAFLNQIEKRLAPVGVFLGDGDDQAQVGFRHFGFGLLSLPGKGLHPGISSQVILGRHADKPFQGLNLVSFRSDDFC